MAPSPGEEVVVVLSTAPEAGVSEAGGNYPGGAAGNQQGPESKHDNDNDTREMHPTVFLQPLQDLRR